MNPALFDDVIRVVDIETTAFEPPEGDISKGVCEIGYCDVFKRGDSAWAVSLDFVAHVCNPLVPIPPENSAVHHIVDADVKDAPAFLDQILRAVHPAHAYGLRECKLLALAAHNAKFEAQWIQPHLCGNLPIICTYKAALRHWPDEVRHSNQFLRYSRKPKGLNRAVAHMAHRAGPDAYVTAFLLRDMLNEGVTLEQLVQWSSEPALTRRCYIGAWRNHLWSEVDFGFLSWVLEKDFDDDVKFSVRFEINRRREEAAKRRADEEQRRREAEKPYVVPSDVPEDGRPV